MKNRFQITVAMLSVSIAKTYRPVGHKLFGIFDHNVALVQDIRESSGFNMAKGNFL